MALAAVFFSTLLLAFGITLFGAGLLGAKYGQGKSRGVGFLLSLVALLIIGIFAVLTWELVPGLEPIFQADIIAQSLVAVLAAMLGSVIGGLAFVSAVMRS